MLNAISSIIILNLISINIPGVAQYVNKVIFSITQLDILPTDLIYDQMFTFDEDNDEPLTPFFDQLGYSNISAVNNLGSAFLIFLLELPLLFFFLPLSLLFR